VKLYKLLEQRENGNGKMCKGKELVLRNSVVYTIKANKAVAHSLVL